MSPARNWREVKAEAHRLHPEMTDPARRAAADARLNARVTHHRLKELRQRLGKTQGEIAAVLGVSQSRISQIENGEVHAMELETLRSYVAALGGHLDVTAGVGECTIKVA